MFSKLISIALVIIPFISVRGQDIRELKLALALGISLVLCLLGFYQGIFKPIKNKFALGFIGFLWLSTMLAPSSGVKLGGAELGTFWAYKPFLYILTAFLTINLISSIKFTKDDLKLILTTITWCGAVMAGFVMLQFLGLDQFFKSNGMPHQQWNLAGTLGHPNFSGSFIAMTIPISIIIKKHWHTLLMILSVFVVQSQVSIGAMVVSLLFLLCFKGKKYIVLSGLIIILLSGLAIGINHIKPEYISDSGRFEHWKLIVQDVNTPIEKITDGEKEVIGKFPITGRGMGSFYYTFCLIHGNNFRQAHNEYLELLYNVGIVGLFLFLGSIWIVLKENWNKGHLKNCLMASFVCALVSAGGLFNWQLGAHIFYTIVIVGLLMNKEITYG
jgi:hypothetical protein